MSGLHTSRRGFLRLSFGGAAGLATLGNLRALPAGASDPDGPAEGSFFSEDEREVLAAIAERMVETGEPGAPALRGTDALGVIDRTCAALPAAVTEQLPLALRLFDWWPFLFELRFRRFRDLSAEERDASLRGWMESRFDLRRLAFFALRNLSLLGYWSQRETWPLIGYRGPLLEDAARSAS